MIVSEMIVEAFKAIMVIIVFVLGFLTGLVYF